MLADQCCKAPQATPALPRPFASIEAITPDHARAILDGNQNNYRKIQPATVKRYSADMKAGRWTLTTGGIGIDVTGQLTNGQHRMSAVCQSGVTCEFVVVRNLPPSASSDPNEDTGIRRNVATHLQHRGVMHSVSVAATARILWNVRKELGIARRDSATLSDSAIAEIVAEDSSIVHAVHSTICCNKIATGSVMAAWAWLAFLEDESLAQECIGIMAGRREASQLHPFVKLRDELLKARSNSKTRGGMVTSSQLRYFFSAWEKAKDGQAVKLLRPARLLVGSEVALKALANFGSHNV